MWIQTYTGKKFYPSKPRIEDIEIVDIAHALSNTCRFNGHVKRFYSVAEHSVRVSRLVWERCSGLSSASRVWRSLQGLLHDASEAYIADITRPVKQLPEFAGYRAIEARLQAAICSRFGLPGTEFQDVTYADREILGTEARQLMDPVHPDWAESSPTETLPEALQLSPLGWSPKKAEYMFLHLFDWLNRHPAPSAEGV